MDKQSAILLLNGDRTDTALFKAIYRPIEHLLICCDGGFSHCEYYGVTPDVIIGDMDSLKKEYVPEGIPLIMIEEQDSSDLDKALRECILRKIKKVTLFCGGGGRWGHVISMFHSMLNSSGKLQLRTILDSSIVTLYKKSFRIPVVPGETVSFFSLHPNGKFQSENLLYALDNKSLFPGKGISLSNKTIGDYLSVSFRNSHIFVIRDVRIMVKNGFIPHF